MKILLRSLYNSCNSCAIAVFISAVFTLTFGANLFAQVTIYKHDFNTGPYSHPYTIAPATFVTGLSSSSWTNSNAAWGSGAGASGSAIQLLNSTGTPTITLTFNIAAGYTVNIDQFNFWRARGSAGAQNWSMTINGISAGSGTVPETGASIGVTGVANPVVSQTGTITVVMSLSGGVGSPPFTTFRLDDFELIGTVCPVVNAGPDQLTCEGSSALLEGMSPIGGTWSDGGAGGTFIPNATALNARYEALMGHPNPITLTLTATGTCGTISDDMILTYGTIPPLELTITGPADGCQNGQVTVTITTTNGFEPRKVRATRKTIYTNNSAQLIMHRESPCSYKAIKQKQTTNGNIPNGE